MYKNKEQIIHWLQKNKIENYSFNEDLSINLKQSVSLFSNTLTNQSLPVQFKESLNVFINIENLTTLKGCPEKVEGLFALHINDQLTHLHYLPKVIKEDLIFDNFKNVDTLLDIKDTQFSFLEIYPALNMSFIELEPYLIAQSIKAKKCYCLSYDSFINKVIPILEKNKLENVVLDNSISINSLNSKIKI